MKKILPWQFKFGVALVVFSALTYYIHYLIFRDARHIFLYLIGDIAFVFIEVLLVTLILHQLLSSREKKGRLKKMNMVIGVFFSETGKKLLAMLAISDAQSEQLTKMLVINKNWTKNDFSKARRGLRAHKGVITSQQADLEGLKVFLLKNGHC